MFQRMSFFSEQTQNMASLQTAVTDTVIHIMKEFASNTGLSPLKQEPRRYLWTDSFAVCNYLGLYQETGDDSYRALAVQLVGQVHNSLGRHRSDDVRKGWISGLVEEEGRLHPTAGGLRIGKMDQERGPQEPYDDQREWDRDGQYFHYLTKWMYALLRVGSVLGDTQHAIWAGELAKTSHNKFVYQSGIGPKRMYWKMSVDLSRPQVPSMGHHDPLDGLVTYQQIRAQLEQQGSTAVNLETEVSNMACICRGKDWVTNDSLGLGGLLCDAYRVMRMLSNTSGGFDGGMKLLENLLDACNSGLKSFTEGRAVRQLERPANYRLAFRELGLSIGLQAVSHMQAILRSHTALLLQNPRLPTLVTALEKHAHLVDKIHMFWSDPANQRSQTWKEHLDINMVMLATSLKPNGFLAA